MMQLQLSHDDVRKLATMFRRPGIALPASSAGNDAETWHLQLRIDLAALVGTVAKFTDSAPVVADLWLQLTITDRAWLRIQLAGLDLDRSELPLLLRPLVRNRMARKQIFAQLKPTDWLQVNAAAENLEVNPAALLAAKKIPLQGTLTAVSVNPEGVTVELTNLSAVKEDDEARPESPGS